MWDCHHLPVMFITVRHYHKILQLVVVLNNVGLSPPASDVHHRQTLSQDTAVTDVTQN